MSMLSLKKIISEMLLAALPNFVLVENASPEHGAQFDLLELLRSVHLLYFLLS